VFMMIYRVLRQWLIRINNILAKPIAVALMG
jgi:hypothetical protein